jgi:oxalate decarboxylase/phosphoglucose isomerase-like protein (cupin superfamily)
VVYAEAGDLAFKPRDQWHTFWNAGDGPCRILEIISPAGFQHYFDELAAGVDAPEDYQSRYGTQVDLDYTRRLCEEHGLQFAAGRS